VSDGIEALETLHTGDEDLHFRFIGMAKERQFTVNVQFASAHDKTGEKLRPEEYDFMILKVLGMVKQHIRARPNPSLN
jgi:hypothetical protein